MSDTVEKNQNYPKPNDFVLSPSFETARIQLHSLIVKFSPHTIPTSVKYCGHRWTSVMESMWDEKDGLLRCYRKFKDHRNFRVGFIEKVFKKASEIKVLNDLNDQTTVHSISILNEIGITYFRVKNHSEERRKIRNETIKKRKEGMKVLEQGMGLFPEPAVIPAQVFETPVSVENNLPEDFGGVKVVSSKNTITPKKINFEEKSLKTPSTVSNKKPKPNRNIDGIKNFDSYQKNLSNLFDKISSTIENINIPGAASNEKEKSDVEKLTELLSVKKILDDNNIDSTVIQTKIENILKNMS